MPDAAAAADNAPLAVQYQLDLQLFPADHRLEGVATLNFPTPAKPAALRLAPQAEVLAVTSAGQAVPFTFRNGQLEFAVARLKGVRQLTIRYRAVFNDPMPRDTVGVEDPSFGVRATILEEGVFLAEGIAWFPQLAGERGRHRVKVSAPGGMLAVTAGRFLGSSSRDGMTIVEWDNDFPLQGLALAAGPFEVARAELDGIQLLTFLSAENAALAPGYLAAMRRHLSYYREMLGPYPFRKFAVVENFLPTGYGLPSWTLIGKSVVRLPFLLDTSLPHEIVHSWWGNAIEVDYVRGNWAEGLTTYLADYLLKERDDPQEAQEYRHKLLRDYAALVAPELDFPLSKFTGRAAKYQQAIGYGKGAMLFHMLRTSIGDEAFRAGLQQMAREGHQASLGWDDLERIFSRSSGQELRWFFRQWVEATGAPTLSLDSVRAARTDRGWQVTGTILQAEPPYRLELRLRLTGDEGAPTEQPLRIAAARTPFRLESATAPRQLEVDPAANLFRRLTPQELPATINDLLTPRRPLVIVAAGQDGLLRSARELLKGLHWEHAELIGEADAEPFALAGRDLLLLGWPRRPELRPALPAGLPIDPAGNPGVNAAGGLAASDTLFAVLAGRENHDGLRALFLSHAPETARPVAAKISHYGRYSLLLFAAGRNVVKTTWQPQSSPLTVKFPRESRP